MKPHNRYRIDYGVCSCCHDPADYEIQDLREDGTLRTRLFCRDCYNELFEGKIKNQNIHLFGTEQTHGIRHGRDPEETDPTFDDIERMYEDNR